VLEHLQLQLFFGIICSYFFAFAVIFGPCASFLEGAFAAMFFAVAVSFLRLHFLCLRFSLAFEACVCG